MEPASTISTISSVFSSVMRKPGRVLRLHADLLEHGLDLRAAAMHDDRIDRGLLQKHDVAGEFARQMLLAHGVAAVFYDHDLLVVALHIGQRFRQDAGLLPRRRLHRGRSWTHRGCLAAAGVAGKSYCSGATATARQCVSFG